MTAWTDEVQPFGANHAPLLTGLSSDNDGVRVPVAVDPATGAILTEGGSGVVGLFTVPYDEIDATYPDSVTEVYVSKLSGVTQQTVTVTYTDSTKDFISTVIRT